MANFEEFMQKRRKICGKIWKERNFICKKKLETAIEKCSQYFIQPTFEWKFCFLYKSLLILNFEENIFVPLIILRL